jgi:O-antigen biosynthesis alpha-1,2-mannosyltransferase
VGIVPEERLPALYRGTIALIFASLYEGFGLPLLEAMACGAPVVTSNVTAMPEVAGGSAMVVDPKSIDQISKAMSQVVTDSSLRRQLRQKGLVRAVEFSWTATVGRVIELLAAL